jgi:hypothetical protein
MIKEDGLKVKLIKERVLEGDIKTYPINKTILDRIFLKVGVGK